MKKLIFLCLTCIALISCSPSNYYQVYKVKSSDAKLSNKYYTAENDDLRISYDFWDQEGIMSFSIYNKTAKPVYIDFSRSHEILNSRSYDYFNGSQVTLSEQMNNYTVSRNYYYPGLVNTFGIGTQRSLTIIQKQIVEIPPQSSISINGYNLIETKYQDCFIRGNKLKEPVKKVFPQDSSPLTFRNYITYDFAPNFSSAKQLDHSFWVEEIDFIDTDSFNGDQEQYRECPTDLPSGTEFTYEYPYLRSNSFYYEVNLKKKK